MNANLAKLIVALLIIMIIYNYMSDQKSKDSQQQLQVEISALKQQVDEKNELMQQQRQQTESLVDEQLHEIAKQMDETKEQSKKIDQQIDSLNTVTENLAEKQRIEAEMMAQQKITAQSALNASYISQGFQTMAMLKVQVVEYYMTNGQFPNTNDDLGISRPTQFATDAIRSVWISKGGRISVVYTAKSGIDKGTLSFTPKDKNNQIHWQCSSRDFKTISRYFPQCKFI
ncbi:MAG: pilin [Alcanivoracaceae bacterium]|nr:pilin [Alcanivoracaceae bacterium]